MQRVFSIHRYKYKIVICIILLFLCSSVFSATYNSATRELSLSSVFYEGKTYTDVVITLNIDGTYLFQGTETTLPFACAKTFDENTPNLIPNGANASEINALLGCHWINSGKLSSSQGLVSYTWVSEKCTSLSVLIDDSGTINSSTSFHRCLNTKGVGFINSIDKFVIDNIIVDNTKYAPATYFRFDTSAKTWQLISAELRDLQSPPHLCNKFTEDFLSAIVLDINILNFNQVGTMLGCRHRPGNSPGALSYVDHDGGSISITGDPETGVIDRINTSFSK